jgi:hypothetical protein
MHFIDTWTNNFAYLGRRAMGTKEALDEVPSSGVEAALARSLRVGL